MSNATVNFRNVTKEYSQNKRTITAVKDLSLSLSEGEIIGLVGPNGAGKSTTVKLLCGILTPTIGQIEVMGLIPFKQRATLSNQIGVMFGQRSSLWYNIPVIESLYLMRDIYSIPRKDFEVRLKSYSERLDTVSLLSVPVRKLSLGQRIRCELLSTLLHNPKLLILDEPTIGLDIAVKTAFREMIREFAYEQGSTILLTTHDLQDVERVCNKVLLIEQGQKRLDLTMSDIALIAKSNIILDLQKVPGTEVLQKSSYYRGTEQDWLKFYLPSVNLPDLIKDIVDLLGSAAIFKTGTPGLEDILYAYYNKNN